MKFFIPLLIFVLVGCGSQPKTEHRDETSTIETPAQPVVHEVKKVELGLWKHFGVVGFVYRDDVKPGTVYGIEGGLVVFKTFRGSVWFVDFEPNDNHDQLDQRRVYLVHISGNLAKGCGYAMREYASAPPQCVMEEKIMSWNETKTFLQPKVSSEQDYWVEIEKFLRRRQWK